MTYNKLREPVVVSHPPRAVVHTPVLLKEVLMYLEPRPGQFMIDGTLDGGGHAQEVIERLAPGGTFLGVDWDHSMVAKFEARVGGVAVHTVHGNYVDLPNILREQKLPKADGLLLDLGFSSEQLEASGRGFSFLREEPLIMTYDDSRTPVHQLLHHLAEKDLATILRDYGGERYAERIAKGIKMAQRKHPIRESKQLANVIRDAAPRGYERGRIDPATRAFQALRIYANDELKNLETVLAELPEILAPGGRAVIITFHSLEDRIVKNAFRDGAKAGTYELLTGKPVGPNFGELRKNPRSRSAKIRAIKLL